MPTQEADARDDDDGDEVFLLKWKPTKGRKILKLSRRALHSPNRQKLRNF